MKIFLYRINSIYFSHPQKLYTLLSLMFLCPYNMGNFLLKFSIKWNKDPHFLFLPSHPLSFLLKNKIKI